MDELECRQNQKLRKLIEQRIQELKPLIDTEGTLTRLEHDYYLIRSELKKLLRASKNG